MADQLSNITRILLQSWEDNGRRWPKNLPKPVETYDANGRRIERGTGDRWGSDDYKRGPR